MEWLDPETGLPWACGGAMVLHTAFDCREIAEQATGEGLDGAKFWTVWTTEFLDNEALDE